jgi:polyisoprenoid-binding protein YceI
MKKTFLLIAAGAFAFTACKDAPEADKAGTGEKVEVKAADGIAYTVDSTTTVSWTGTKPTGAHTGNFKVTASSLTVKDGNLSGGSLTIDIASINNTDMTGEEKGKLEGHLKSPDFFDVAKFPTAKFEITGVETFKYDSTSMKDVIMKDATHLIKGNLTLKDSTKNISFPAKVSMSGDQLTAAADFNIDRTLWGMNYKGPNNPQDWMIRKEVNLKFNIKATKK